MPAKRTYMPGPVRKQAILEAAATVFAAKGYRGSSIDDIVEAAEISKGTFYIYFGSRKDAFVELVESFFDEFARILKENHERLEQTIDRGGDVIQALRENVMSVLGFHGDNPDLTVIAYREALGRDEEFSDRFDELNQFARRLQREEFKTMADRGLMRPEDIDLVTSITMGAAVEVIMEHILGKKRPDIEGLADSLLEYHARALAPKGMNIDKALGEVLKKPGKKSSPGEERRSA
jgi:AcrR family transcriptional regulator